jgi:hypothetical protein
MEKTMNTFLSILIFASLLSAIVSVAMIGFTPQGVAIDVAGLAGFIGGAELNGSV